MQKKEFSRCMITAAGSLALHMLCWKIANQNSFKPVFTRYRKDSSPVSLMGGLAALSSAGLATALSPDRKLAGIAFLTSLPWGLLDDYAESILDGRAGENGEKLAAAKGLTGHLQAIKKGRITTGALKIAGGALNGLATAALAGKKYGRNYVDLAIDTVTVAGCSNLINLLDLAPGRALKTLIIANQALALAPLNKKSDFPTLMSVVALSNLPGDLAGDLMLGDGGAVPLGSLLGSVVVDKYGRKARLALAVGVVGLVLASEKISFSKVITQVPALNWIDQWGRKPR